MTHSIWNRNGVVRQHYRWRVRRHLASVVVTNIDNFLRPILVPRAARLDPALMLLAVFSGIAMFGFWGIVIGPVLMIVVVTTISVYLAVYKDVPLDQAADEDADVDADPKSQAALAIPLAETTGRADAESPSGARSGVILRLLAGESY